MNPIDQIMRGLLRGFGWTLGRRAANRLPLWATIAVVVLLYFLKGHGR